MMYSLDAQSSTKKIRQILIYPSTTMVNRVIHFKLTNQNHSFVFNYLCYNIKQIDKTTLSYVFSLCNQQR